MANWTVNEWSNAEVVGDNVTAGSMAAYIDLTISPYTPYVLSASQFLIGGATESPANTWTGGNVDVEVYKVVFSDNGTAGTAGNTVNARVHFSAAATGGSSWSMPSANKDIYIDIDEDTEAPPSHIHRYFCIKSHHNAETDGNGVNKHTVDYASAPSGVVTSTS